MNHEIIAASESRSKDVKLIAFRKVGRESEEGLNAASMHRAGFDADIGGIVFDGTESEIVITLSIPDGGFKHVDMQWAADITEGGHFVGDYPGDPTVQCDGQRGIGKRKSSELKIKIDDSVDIVEVWAGWATEHEAVTLTERLRLVRSESKVELRNNGSPPKTGGEAGPPKS
eukprot:CAMPEP_0113526512 /NCGR_PEP_ID=MMETSP0015_2-20120614/782_1 /TAXON_ID=2838 /ORGANISM="Odontella" /LENGTH=171 /DNA_ID=CAMNT_0000424845 /DNA_START=251 /DNA_END=763 /DNA_ORIENTATION=- /assembly_acc=CAM_ASM_000160